MSGILERLLGDKSASTSKSYFIGLERGRIWAEDYADYFEVREWGEKKVDDIADLILPDSEDFHLRLLGNETPLELDAYIRGWLAGVKEVAGK